MILENIVVGITQLVVAIILAVVGMAMGFQIFGRLTNKIDEEKELAKGNVAVGILVASIFVSMAIIIQSGVSGISIGLKGAISGNIYPLIASIVQLVFGIILAVVAIYLSINIFDRMTEGVDEFKELEKGNVAVALELASVIIAVAIIIQSGVSGITNALF